MGYIKGLGDRVKEKAIEHRKQQAARDIVNEINEYIKGTQQGVAKKRWIFELIQNAIDTAKARGKDRLQIVINKNGNRFTFKHNGGYFTLDELSAIIYGGSTKPFTLEKENKKYIGRFGKGFLVTHIISRIVEIKGFIECENENKLYKFKMEIDRKGDDDKSISEGIEKCFQQLNNNYEELSELPREEDAYTEFIYNLNDDNEKEALEIGISELKKVLPFIFAFNDVIEEIIINGEKFLKPSIEIHKDNMQIIKVKSSSYNNLPTVYLKKDDSIVVGIMVKDKKIVSLKGYPKIYIGMPLIKTADYINIPFVINSFSFEPTNERGALLDDQKNKELLSQAIKLWKELLEKISKDEEIKGLFNAVDIQLISENKIQQGLWENFNENLKNIFNQIIKEIKLVDTFEGRKEIYNTIFPVYGEMDKIEDNTLKKNLFNDFFNLINQINKNIPIQDEKDDWIDIAVKLKNQGFGISLYSIKDMIGKLKDLVVRKKVEYTTFEELTDDLGVKDAKQFLCALFEIVDRIYEYLKSLEYPENIKFLIPNQKGKIRLHPKIHVDENIPEDLKDIVEKIGLDIREELLDKDFAKYQIIVKYYVQNKMNIENVMKRILYERNLYPSENMLKKDPWDERITGWINLFAWCIKNKKLEPDFPVITKERKIRELKNLDDLFLLIPFKYMGINEKYEEIYPENRILHSKYFEIGGSDDILKNIKNYKTFITKLPIYENIVTFEKYNKLKAILTKKSELSEGRHNIKSEEEIISFLPFWDEVIGKISKDPEKGKLFFEFIIKYLINYDDSWKKEIIVKCSCKDGCHEIIPSHWLASLKYDKWVPSKRSENGEEIEAVTAKKDSIENLFTPDEFKELIKSASSENVIKLLQHIGFDEHELNIMLYSYKKNITVKEVKAVISKLITSGLIDLVINKPDFLNRISENPEIFQEIMENTMEKLEKKQMSKENKKIGENIEIIIAKIFQNKDFNVKIIYGGGDLEIWPEKEGWDCGVIEIEPYLIEVKFTSTKRVHLSNLQFEKALEKKENYIVLVIENVNNLRERLKEISPDSIDDEIINIVIKNSKVIEEIYKKLEDFKDFHEGTPEIEPNLSGYWIKKELWGDKDDIIKWIERKFSRC